MSQENRNSAPPTGLDADEPVTLGEIKNATERAFKYQRYIARRTFALYYLAWAAAILFVVGSPNLMTLVGLSGALGETFQLIVRLIALAGAASITAVIFRDARRILMVRRALDRGKWIYSRYAGGLILWMFVVASAYVVVSWYFPTPPSRYFPGPAYSNLVFYALLLPIPFLLYRLMSLAFPDQRPVEGPIALTTFAVAAVISLALYFPPKGNSEVDFWKLGWVWGATALVWLLSAVYAFFSAQDELEALRS